MKNVNERLDRAVLLLRYGSMDVDVDVGVGVDVGVDVGVGVGVGVYNCTKLRLYWQFWKRRELVMGIGMDGLCSSWLGVGAWYYFRSYLLRWERASRTADGVLLDRID